MKDYLIYPEAMPIIEAVQVDKRLKDIEEKDTYYSPFGFVSASEVYGRVEYLKEEGRFKGKTPEDISFRKTIQDMYQNLDNFHYLIDGKKASPLEYEHLSLLLGWDAGYILSPEEISNYKSYGASSLSEFLGTVGAYMNTSSQSRERGMHFSTFRDEKKFDNVISGSTHLDLRIDQTDITRYNSIDPFGNKVHYRPLTSQDNNCIGGHHTVEADLFTSILRYAYHNDIETPLFENNAKKLFDHVETLPNLIGNATPFSDSEPSYFFNFFHFPLRKINAQEKFDTRLLVDTIDVEPFRGSWYSIATDPDKNLIIGRPKENILKPIVQYKIEDIDNLTLSLFHQVSHGFGRTSLNQLSSILKFRYSDEFNDLDKHEDIHKIINATQ